jgi:hypothetical protein
MAWAGLIRIMNVSTEWRSEQGNNHWFHKMRETPWLAEHFSILRMASDPVHYYFIIIFMF